MQQHQMLRSWVIGLATVVMLAFTGAALAQMGGQPSALEREYMEIQQRLSAVQQRAMANNPQLQEQSDALEQLLTEKTRAAGYDIGSITETILATQAKLEQARTDAERQQIMESAEVREAQKLLQEAQEAALADPEVQAAMRGLEEDMMAAMRREEPEMDRLIGRLEEIQRQAQSGMR